MNPYNDDDNYCVYSQFKHDMKEIPRLFNVKAIIGSDNQTYCVNAIECDPNTNSEIDSEFVTINLNIEKIIQQIKLEQLNHDTDDVNNTDNVDRDIDYLKDKRNRKLPSLKDSFIVPYTSRNDKNDKNDNNDNNDKNDKNDYNDNNDKNDKKIDINTQEIDVNVKKGKLNIIDINTGQYKDTDNSSYLTCIDRRSVYDYKRKYISYDNATELNDYMNLFDKNKSYLQYDDLKETECKDKNSIDDDYCIFSNIYYKNKNDQQEVKKVVDNITTENKDNEKKENENIKENDVFVKDSIVNSVINKFIKRSVFGENKYGTNLDRNDLSLLQWINHAQEEHMDAILYLEKIKKIIAN